MRQKVCRLARAVPAWILVVVLILSMLSVAHAEDSAPIQVHEGEIELTANDIFNWINNCQDPLTLRNLGNAALSFAAALEHPDVDDFRSRA